MFCSKGRRLIVWFTLFCFVTTQTVHRRSA